MITDEDELKIKRNYSRSDKNCLKKGHLYASDIKHYMDFLQKRDDEKCLKDIKEKPSLLYDVTFIKFNKNCQPHYKESKGLKAKRKDIFKSKHIFIPIQYGNHFTCVVIIMEEGKRRIDYYDSLKANQTRLEGVYKYKLQISILQVVLSYLQAKHVKLNKDKAWSNDWITNPSCSAPQQENRIDCGVFVCMYIDFILDGCKLDFTQKDKDSGGWQRKMMLSILPVERDDKDEDEDNEYIQDEQKQRMEFGKKALKIISEDKEWKDNVVSTKLSWENKSAKIECDENCQGGEGCVNKRMQKFEWKEVVERKKEGKGFGGYKER
jgi:hypothetical protein